MTKVQVFKSEEFGAIRTVDVNGEPWFVGKDVAEALGYVKARNAIAEHVSEEDKSSALIQGGTSPLGGNPNMTVINESGLYSLILSSKKPEAKKFKRWVTSEVLPSLRKHGMYAAADLLDNPDLLIKAATALKEEREKVKRLEAEAKVQALVIAGMSPKVSYFDTILQCKDVVPVTQIAKDYGISGQKLNKLLCAHGVQFKQAGQWYLYQRYAQRGYTQSKTYLYKAPDGTPHSKPLTCWTQEGRKFLYWFLRDLGIVPVVEQSVQADIDPEDCD